MRRPVLLFAVAAALTLGACTSDGDGPTGTSPATPGPSGNTRPATTTPASSTSASSTARPTTSSPAPTTPGQKALARLGLRERVGQLIMIDCPSDGVSDATRTAVQRYHVGSVILDGTTQSGVGAVRDVTDELRSITPDAPGLFIATDQEGGLVQRLQGPGFDRIPSGVQQGALAPSALQAAARGWGRQLRDAGVDVDLAPVLDVPSPDGGPNPPVADLDRQYGTSPSGVSSHGLAFARGLTASGVAPAVKHFPGLGRVTGNTDVASGITDTVTGGASATLRPFRDAVRAGVPFVMMSTAIYSRLDPGTPAAFSRPIVTGLLRGTLGFRGVVVSDDVGAADQVASLTPGQRAVRFVAAGGDIVLSVVASQAREMTAALVARARSDPAFRRLVDTAASRVLDEKARRGLLG